MKSKEKPCEPEAAKEDRTKLYDVTPNPLSFSVFLEPLEITRAAIAMIAAALAANDLRTKEGPLSE